MDCPRCDGSLVTYTLGDERAAVCRSCGYVGVPADHHPKARESESWRTALRRFRERRRAADAVAIEIDGTTYRAPPDVAERYGNLTEKQRAVIRELLHKECPTDPDRTLTAIAEAAGVHRSYVSEIVDRYGDIAAALVED